MITYFLAAVLVFDMQTKPPLVLKPYTSGEACHVEAIARNNDLSKEKKEAGFAYFCLKAEWPGA